MVLRVALVVLGSTVAKVSLVKTVSPVLLVSLDARVATV